MMLKDLKKGEFFTIAPIENPKDSQVFVKGEYDRRLKRYVCCKFCDIFHHRLFKGDRMVYTEFVC